MSSLSSGLIAGIVIASVAFVILVGTISYCVYKNYYVSDDDDQTETTTNNQQQQQQQIPGSVSPQQQQPNNWWQTSSRGSSTSMNTNKRSPSPLSPTQLNDINSNNNLTTIVPITSLSNETVLSNQRSISTEEQLQRHVSMSQSTNTGRSVSTSVAASSATTANTNNNTNLLFTPSRNRQYLSSSSSYNNNGPDPECHVPPNKRLCDGFHLYYCFLDETMFTVSNENNDNNIKQQESINNNENQQQQQTQKFESIFEMQQASQQTRSLFLSEKHQTNQSAIRNRTIHELDLSECGSTVALLQSSSSNKLMKATSSTTEKLNPTEKKEQQRYVAHAALSELAAKHFPNKQFVYWNEEQEPPLCIAAFSSESAEKMNLLGQLEDVDDDEDKIMMAAAAASRKRNFSNNSINTNSNTLRNPFQIIDLQKLVSNRDSIVGTASNPLWLMIVERDSTSSNKNKIGTEPKLYRWFSPANSQQNYINTRGASNITSSPTRINNNNTTTDNNHLFEFSDIVPPLEVEKLSAAKTNKKQKNYTYNNNKINDSETNSSSVTSTSTDNDDEAESPRPSTSLVIEMNQKNLFQQPSSSSSSRIFGSLQQQQQQQQRGGYNNYNYYSSSQSSYSNSRGNSQMSHLSSASASSNISISFAKTHYEILAPRIYPYSPTVTTKTPIRIVANQYWCKHSQTFVQDRWKVFALDETLSKLPNYYLKLSRHCPSNNANRNNNSSSFLTQEEKSHLESILPFVVDFGSRKSSKTTNNVPLPHLTVTASRDGTMFVKSVPFEEPEIPRSKKDKKSKKEKKRDKKSKAQQQQQQVVVDNKNKNENENENDEEEEQYKRKVSSPQKNVSFADDLQRQQQESESLNTSAATSTDNNSSYNQSVTQLLHVDIVPMTAVYKIEGGFEMNTTTSSSLTAVPWHFIPADPDASIDEFSSPLQQPLTTTTTTNTSTSSVSSSSQHEDISSRSRSNTSVVTFDTSNLLLHHHQSTRRTIFLPLGRVCVLAKTRRDSKNVVVVNSHHYHQGEDDILSEPSCSTVYTVSACTTKVDTRDYSGNAAAVHFANI